MSEDEFLRDLSTMCFKFLKSDPRFKQPDSRALFAAYEARFEEKKRDSNDHWTHRTWTMRANGELLKVYGVFKLGTRELLFAMLGATEIEKGQHYDLESCRRLYDALTRQLILDMLADV